MVRPRQVTDEEILAAARTCFLRDGPAVSTTVIAEALGISQAALFKRFGTKNELLLAALAPPAKPEWIADIEQGLEEGPVREQLVAIGCRLVAFFQQIVPCLSVLRASGIGPEEMLARYDVPPPLRGQRAIAELFRKAMAAGRIRTTDPDALAYAFLGGLQMRAFLAHIADLPLDATDEIVARHVDLLWEGIAPEEAP